MHQVNVGDRAPLWMLFDQNERKIDYKEYIGKKNVVLSFHPLAWTPVCARQMQDLEAEYEQFRRHDTIAFGLSVDSVPCKNAWARSLGVINTSLPADFWPHGEVAKSYGVFLDKLGYSERAVFLVGKDGKVAFKKVYPSEQVPDIDEVVREVMALSNNEPVRK